MTVELEGSEVTVLPVLLGVTVLSLVSVLTVQLAVGVSLSALAMNCAVTVSLCRNCAATVSIICALCRNCAVTVSLIFLPFPSKFKCK